MPSDIFFISFKDLGSMPLTDFSIHEIPLPYDYSNTDAWFLLDSRPPMAGKSRQEYLEDKTPVVFFIHPTTFFGRENWMQHSRP